VVKNPRRASVATPVTEAAPAESVSAFSTGLGTASAGGAGTTPSAPAESPVASALLAAARRHAMTVGPAAAATSAQQVSSRGFTVEATVELVDGIFQGAVTANGSGFAYLYEAIGGSNGGKLQMGTVPNGGPQSFVALPYATWLDSGTKGTEQFSVRVRELTLFDALATTVPLLGGAALPIVAALQDTPLIGVLLAPIIGSSRVVTFDVDVAATGDRPVAFTYKVSSFDGVKISTNFFPAAGLSEGQTAATTIVSPGFGGPGLIDPYSPYALKNEVPGNGTLRYSGYNVVSYDPRGEFDSGGVMHMASPAFEGKDIGAIVDWIAENPLAALNASGDPKVGMVGGSYGGALQLAAAGNPDIDAMVPVDSWSTLLDTFYPSNTFKTGYGALYMLNLILSRVNVQPQLYLAVATGLGFNWLGPRSRELMIASNPPLAQQTTPTLVIRGTEDVLVPLDQGAEIAQVILGNGLSTPVKTFWFTGGHGGANTPTGQSNLMLAATLGWLDAYVRGNAAAADAIPDFQWFDQDGVRFTSPLQAFEDGFNDLPDVTATSTGGLLGIIPLLGGSGPGAGGLPISIVNASAAGNAIDVQVPTEDLAEGTQVVGAPVVSFTYRGLGTSGAVFAQVVDKTTGAVLGNLVTPVPVTLDGRERTVNVDIGEIAYTVGAGDSLVVQITSSATAFANAAFGLIDISDVTVTLPNRTATAP
jgi:ABC-2 type transport system ATP-binding protein